MDSEPTRMESDVPEGEELKMMMWLDINQCFQLFVFCLLIVVIFFKLQHNQVNAIWDLQCPLLSITPLHWWVQKLSNYPCLGGTSWTHGLWSVVGAGIRAYCGSKPINVLRLRIHKNGIFFFFFSFRKWAVKIRKVPKGIFLFSSFSLSKVPKSQFFSFLHYIFVRTSLLSSSAEM